MESYNDKNDVTNNYRYLNDYCYGLISPKVKY
jgi:hypothetical protein